MRNERISRELSRVGRDGRRWSAVACGLVARAQHEPKPGGRGWEEPPASAGNHDGRRGLVQVCPLTVSSARAARQHASGLTNKKLQKAWQPTAERGRQLHGKPPSLLAQVA